ncbi:MAG: YqaA family protein, partial [Candidatus Saccharimonadales bacterium]|nr:YqaA family protein [Candidatus Saccharimonadales bacterium]
QKRPSPIRRLYQWFLKWAEKPNAEKALFGFSFAESSFFPIPPDPLLMAMVFAKTKRWVRYAAVTTVASILGGILGYIIGIGLFESIGNWILDTYHLHDDYKNLGELYQDNSFLAVLTAAMTPVPYKIITISAGAFKINFVAFIVASIIGRAARFFGVSALAHYLGKKHKEKIERYLDIISLALVTLLVLVLVLL